MAAALTDLFRKFKAFGGATTLSSGISNADTSISGGSFSGYPTDTATDLVIDRVNSAGTPTPTTREVVTATISGNTATTDASRRGEDGTSAQSHTAAAVVENNLTGNAWNDLIDGILTHTDQDGTLKAGAVDVAAVLASDVVTTAKILDANVTLAKLAAEAWTTYTPAWTGSSSNPVIGNGTLSGKSAKIGRTVIGQIIMIAGSGTTYGSGEYIFSLPYTPVTTNGYHKSIGNFVMLDSSTGTSYMGQVHLFSSDSSATFANKLGLKYHSIATAGAQVNIQHNAPVPFAQSDYLSIFFAYETAS